MAKQVNFVWRGPQVAASLIAQAYTGLLETAEEILAESQALVPRESGQLAESGRVIPDPANMQVVISYGDDELRHSNRSAANAYAVRQHEDMELKHPNGGQAKFLEQPLKAKAERLGANVAKHVREVTK